jgi:hypothetical protein
MPAGAVAVSAGDEDGEELVGAGFSEVLDTGDEVGVVPAAAAAADTVFDDGDLGDDEA